MIDALAAMPSAHRMHDRGLTLSRARGGAIIYGIACSASSRGCAATCSMYAHRSGSIHRMPGHNRGATLAKRIISEVDVALLVRGAHTKRDRVLLEVLYAAGLRVSEVASLAWADVLMRDKGHVQLSITGKGGSSCSRPAAIGVRCRHFSQTTQHQRVLRRAAQVCDMASRFSCRRGWRYSRRRNSRDG
jgi:hypothetical protein